MSNNFITFEGEENLSKGPGAAYIFFGYSGLDTNNINAANANVTIYGNASGDLFGWSVSDSDDVNGDNIDDVIIGAPDADDFTASSSWWDSSWLKRKKLTFDNFNYF